MVEQGTENPRVRGSIPFFATISFYRRNLKENSVFIEVFAFSGLRYVPNALIRLFPAYAFLGSFCAE